MKKIFCIACLTSLLLTIITVANAQNENPQDLNKRKKLENVFVGGNINAGFSKYAGGFGVSPVVGYHLNKYFDAGVNLSYSHSWNKDFYYSGSKSVQNNFGAGIFGRAFPVDFLFVQAQLEQNFFNEKYKASSTSSYVKYSANAPSFLVGGGLVSGRVNQSTYFYFSVMVDVLRNKNSPYISKEGRMQPVFGAGVNIGLFSRALYGQ